MRTQLIHCSYHKCLTRYFKQVFGALRKSGALPGGYYHFRSFKSQFESESRHYRVSSINNHTLDMNSYPEARVTRFIRDPRDLLVSGYFYHLRAPEAWCNIVDPTDSDLEVVNGTVPVGLTRGLSYSQYLSGLSLKEGLLAEIEFRRKHFESMASWPGDNERLQTFRYEDIINNEARIFDQIFRFQGLPWATRQLGIVYARYFASRRFKSRNTHIRDPRAGQWAAVLPGDVKTLFNRQYRELLLKLDYSTA